MSWAAVIPTCRPEQAIDFLDAWDDHFIAHAVRVYLICDLDEPDTGLDAFARGSSYQASTHYPDEWPGFVPRHTDMCRSWGIHLAWRDGHTYTLTLDDDVRPAAGVALISEYEQVFASGLPLSDWLSVGALTTYGKPLRGFPDDNRWPRTVALQYGGWNGVLDYDAQTQLRGTKESESFYPVVLPVPRGVPTTGSMMNAAWRTDNAPILWQLPLHEGRYNRYGDIWSGLFAKRVLDHSDEVVAINGRAVVEHRRASDPQRNAELEAVGRVVSDALWDALPTASWTDVTDAAGRFFEFDPDYADAFVKGRDQWLQLFQTSSGKPSTTSRAGSPAAKRSSSSGSAPATGARSAAGKAAPHVSWLPPDTRAGASTGSAKGTSRPTG